MSAETERLPHVDEHSLVVGAGVAATWDALQRAVPRFVSSPAAPPMARLLGCTDTEAAGPRPLAPSSTMPGFHVAAATSPSELALAGRHRFSRYALIFRLDELDADRTRVRAETRAEFPGFRGSVYETLVIRTRMHVLATRRILTAVKRGAER